MSEQELLDIAVCEAGFPQLVGRVKWWPDVGAVINIGDDEPWPSQAETETVIKAERLIWESLSTRPVHEDCQP